MPHIHENFDGEEWKQLVSEKKRRGVSWHDFIMELAVNKKERIKEIIELANKLGWIYPPNNTSYPLMQVSEIEKCMIAMHDGFEFERMQRWAADRKAMPKKPTQKGEL
jgi:hypothetical protein